MTDDFLKIYMDIISEASKKNVNIWKAGVFIDTLEWCEKPEEHIDSELKNKITNFLKGKTTSLEKIKEFFDNTIGNIKEEEEEEEEDKSKKKVKNEAPKDSSSSPSEGSDNSATFSTQVEPAH